MFEESFLSLISPFYFKEKDMKLGEMGIEVNGKKKRNKYFILILKCEIRILLHAPVDFGIVL